MYFIRRKYKRLQKLLKRHTIFHFFRCFMITRKPSHKVFSDEIINNYNCKKDIPPLFVLENMKIVFQKEGSFRKAIAIAKFMGTTYTGGRGLGYSSEETLTIMKANKGGVCSDYSQLMINFCILNDIKVREWSVSAKLYGTFGHVFNEVYSDEYDKWVFIDAAKSFYFIDRQTKLPISSIEYIDLLTASMEHLVVAVNILTGQVDESITNKEAIHLAYFNKTNVFFLVSNYRIWWFDRILKLRKILPLPVLHFILIGIGNYYKYHFYINELNDSNLRGQLATIGRKNYGSTFLNENILLHTA